MPVQSRTSPVARIIGEPVARTAAFYALVGAAVAVLWWRSRSADNPFARRTLEALAGAPVASFDRGIFGPPTVDASAPGNLAMTAVVAMVCAALLALPVAWIYILTRQKRGYRQSVVQTLVLLPAVVGGVVVLVQHSVALAFSLAGIVAAVRFRNTLEDSKDAVYIFLATGLGLAAGVQPAVALVLSVVFNSLMLALWYADFGRTPSRLEGREAERRMARSLAIANRTGQFVARIDNEILKAMSPEQLDALADRAWRRRRRNAPDLPTAPPPSRDDVLLRVRTATVEEARRALEPALGQQLKRWRYGGVVHEDDGTHVLEYVVQLRRSVPADVVRDALRAQGAPHVTDVQLG
ncbi:MAG: DUF4956 domain-containing protein [Gemmatimonadota bacterium]|nr:DUF4956 domain-containing protein [Gemmatimonadota bacterium]